MQHLFILDICNFRQAIIWQFLWPGLFPFLLLGWIYLVLLSLNEMHKLIDGLERIIFHLVILLATWAVNVLVLLTYQVLNDSLNLRRKVTLDSVPLDWLDVLLKFFEIYFPFQRRFFSFLL